MTRMRASGRAPVPGRPPRRTLTLAWLLAGVIGVAGIASAQVRVPGVPAPASEAAPEEQPAGPTPEAIAAERDALAASIASLRSELAEGNAPAPRLERLALLERLDRTLADHQEALQHLAALREAGAQPSGGGSLIGAAPPYPFALYEATSQALDATRKQEELLAERARAEREEIERLARELETADRERRRAREEVEASTDALETARLAEKLGRLETQSRLAAAELARTRTQAELDAFAAERQRSQVELLEATLRHVRGRLSVTRYDLDEPLHRITLAEEDARAALDQTKQRLATAERRLAEAQQRLEREPQPSAALRAELDARRRQRQLAQAQITAEQVALERLGVERQVWERRLAALAGAERSETALWTTEVERALDQLRRNQRLQATHEQELAQDVARLREALAAADAATAPWLREELQAAEALQAAHARASAEAADTRAFLARSLRDLAPPAGERDLLGELRLWLSRVGSVWERELFVVDDRSITVGKITVALVLFVLGVSLSRFFSRLLARLVYRRAFTPGAALASESLTFYALLVAFFLVALRTVNIPLTAFALLGGALAIGIGFGSQNVISNFISGLILLVERPINVGDVVEVEGIHGTVDRIGPRSTRIRTFDNLHLIVPNSLLLEHKVVNWTLSDVTVRRQVNVGVAYDAPVREVTRLIRRALDEHGLVLPKPEPKVVLQDFASDALLFRAYFWMRIDAKVAAFEVEGDLRHRILHLFRDAGIVIAFPQRDVHLDAARPLEVRLLPPEDASQP
jgi:small-conductance mechanosensitive channel